MKHNSIFTRLIALALVIAFATLTMAGCAFFQPKINGISIGKYTIVYDSDQLDYNKRAAEYIQASIEDLTGAKLDVKEDGEGQFEHEIVVGETNREISAKLNAECVDLEFAILADENHIALEGAYFIIAAAAYYFVHTYVANSAEIEVGKVNVEQPIQEKANNYILLIGDGMGEAHTRLYEAYDAPADGKEAYSDGEDFFYGYLLPYFGYAKTDSLDGTTDSAAAATALASGYKTHNGYVGLKGDGSNVRLLTELASSLGKAAAVMSTEKRTGATPSGFSSHAPDRYDSDAVYEAQLAHVNAYGTIVDCGYDYYTVNQIKIVENHISDTLAAVSADENGFFLMYEEAYIDKHSSDNDAYTTFLALMRFNQAIGLFMEYAFYNPDTMVIITADHETGGLTVADGSCSYVTEEHTSANVPIFAYGADAQLFDGQTIENTQIAKTLAALMGELDFGDPDTAPAIIKP